MQARIASLLAFAYVVVLLGGTLIHFANTGDALTLRFSLAQPATWLAAVIAAVVSWGLWQRYAWAWWLGLAAAAVQLFRLGAWLFDHFSLARLPGGTVMLVLVLLIAFLTLLLTPKARAACSR